jgi:hypothetical protein
MGLGRGGNHSSMLRTQVVNINESQKRALRMRRKMKRDIIETVKSVRMT